MERVCAVIILAVITQVKTEEYGQCSKGRTDFLPGIIQSFYSSLNASECELAENTKFNQYDPADGEDFDFIIVGAGASGSVVANKLSANPNWKVLLLEAGGDPTMTTEIPGLAFFSQGSDIDWKYSTEPEEGIYWGMPVNGSAYWPRGRGIGGSTLLNAMVYTRGNPEDYNEWKKWGNNKWAYDDLLPHFVSFEDMKADEVLKIDSCSKYHGTKGELSIESYTRSQLDPYSKSISDGLKTLGLGLYPDYNNPEMLKKGGFYFMQATIKNGKRCNAGKAFLKPVQNRENLKISKNSFVTKISIDKKTKTATGVEFKNKLGKTIQVLANKETIVSAGAINTPQLMMLSGVGPKKLLEAQGIDVVYHSPFVGANLKDHPMFPGILISVDKLLPASDKNLMDQLFEFLNRGSGTMMNLGTIGSNLIFINSGFSSSGYPDVELLMAQIDKNSSSTVGQLFGSYTPEVIKLINDVNKNKAIILIRGVVLKPQSKGRIFLKTNNPEDHPKIYSGYFRDVRDFKPLISGIRIIQRLVQSKPMQDIGAKLEILQYPKCKQFYPDSDNYWACAIRYLVGTTYHPCCTMKMGPDSDTTAVVDSTLKVKGIGNLRAVDMSITPSLVSAHTQTTAYVIAHNAADMIKKEHSRR